MNYPDKNEIFPMPGFKDLCFIKNIITKSNIIAGDYSYFHDFDDVYNFEKNVKYHFDWMGDRLIIGKFCMIAHGATFIMNGASHLVDAISPYPFAKFEKDWAHAMDNKNYPFKGDTVIGNDVWIGYNATIMPGVHIGDGAIIATNATVTKNVEPYTIVGGNPAQVIKKRFSEEHIAVLLELQWWNWDIEKITRHVHLLTSNNLDAIKNIE
jgi:virginiamycin A acetyltransferase